MSTVLLNQILIVGVVLKFRLLLIIIYLYGKYSKNSNFDSLKELQVSKLTVMSDLQGEKQKKSTRNDRKK